MRRKQRALIFLAALALQCAACAPPAAHVEQERPAASSSAVFPAAPAQGSAEKQPEAPAEAARKSGLYDPSIFVIEASGSWRQELAPGYFADYECELYLDKFDANDNRSASGLYTGVFWMKTTLDVAQHLQELLKNIPVQMDLEAGGEGVCDNLTVHLLDGYARDPFGDYAIPDGQGKAVEPVKEALAGEGSFIAVGTQAYLEAQAQGAAGERLEHRDAQTGDAVLQYVIQVAPDPQSTASERSVLIHLSDAQGMAATIEGTWQRFSGYPEDRLKYANENKPGQVLERRLK